MHPVAAILMVLAAPVALRHTAEELAAKNVEARGGIDKLHAIQSLRFSGKILVNGGTLELGYVSLLKRPQSVRYEAALQGLTLVQAYDGAQAWHINPFQGRKDPEKLPADDAKGLGEDAADFAGTLVDYKAKDYTLDYLGTKDVDGTEAHKLRVTRPNGDVTYVYLDPDYFLEVRAVNRRIEHGVPNETVIGPRVLPGTYTIRLHKNDSAYENPVTIGLDTRVKWSLEDRKTQHEGAMKVYALFNDESALFARIAGMREQVAEATKSRPKGDALLRPLEDFDGKLDAIRKKIVATKEGGAITGGERLREHTDQLYGAITSWDGPPSAYQLENIAALRTQLGEIEGEFTRVISTQLPVLNNALKSNGAAALTVPPLAVFSDGEPGSGGVAVNGRYDPDAARGVQVPSNLKLWN